MRLASDADQPVVLNAARLIRDDGSVAPGSVRLRDGRIADIAAAHSDDPDAVELPSGYLAPGFVDLQFNGAHGIDLAHADETDWRALLTALPSTGTTSVVATFVTAPVRDLVASLRTARGIVATTHVRGARCLGVHLEGPFLAPRWRGAHDPAYLLQPDRDTVQTLLDAADGALVLLTLAPELTGAIETIETLVRAGVAVSVGHSGASGAEVAAAADAGATLITHLFNAQTGLHHREAGVVGHALADPRLTATLIADLAHVGPEACVIAFAAKPGRIALITDSVAAAGLAPGMHHMPDGDVTVGADGIPRRPTGVLAGSALRLDQAVRNIVSLGIGVSTAVHAASRVPADQLGRDDLGRIAPGAHADLVWLSDDLVPQAVWVGGRLVHHVPKSSNALVSSSERNS